jgi:hypothetical protein
MALRTEIELQNIEQGISNFEMPACLAPLLRFNIPCSIFDIHNILI